MQDFTAGGRVHCPHFKRSRSRHHGGSKLAKHLHARIDQVLLGFGIQARDNSLALRSLDLRLVHLVLASLRCLVETLGFLRLAHTGEHVADARLEPADKIAPPATTFARHRIWNVALVHEVVHRLVVLHIERHKGGLTADRSLTSGH